MNLNENSTLIITGGAGFIGSNLIRALNDKGINQIIIVDNFKHNKEKWRNLIGLDYHTISDIGDFYSLFNNIENEDLKKINLFIHLGGRADTKGDIENLLEMNYKSSVAYLSLCRELNIPFFYASSAATYGNADFFHDNHYLLGSLEPNNAYAMSKHIFDLLVTKRGEMLEISCGMKFFNVYGPGEMHKNNMASIISRIITSNDEFELYHINDWYRDFIYIDNVIDIILFLIERNARGIYNVGSGKGSSWEDVYKGFIKVNPKIQSRLKLIKNPEVLPEFFGDDYQKNTKADIGKLKKLGYKKKILTLQQGIKKYSDLYSS